MKRILVSWIGRNDLEAINGKSQGPISATVTEIQFDHIRLIYNYTKKEVAPYLKMLRTRTNAEITATKVSLKSPVDFSEIYPHAEMLLSEVSTSNNQVTILLSPGTPAMQAIWILLGKTKFNVRFLQSSREQGVEEVDIPFDIVGENWCPLSVS